MLMRCCTGNMAGESAAVRLHLQANGAVRPLLHLVLPAQVDPTQQAISAAATAAWALSSMLQGNASAVSDTFRSTLFNALCIQIQCMSPSPCRMVVQDAMSAFEQVYTKDEKVMVMPAVSGILGQLDMLLYERLTLQLQ